MLAVITAGAIAGLVAAPHCALMCGPLGMHATRSHLGMLRYQAGRLVSYVIAGALAGLFGDTLITWIWGSKLASTLSWALALSLLFAAYRVWPRSTKEPARTEGLITLKAPAKRPLVARILGLLPARPEVLGASSVFLPCAALWSGIAIAAASASPSHGATTMIAFSVTSGCGVWASGLLGKGISHFAFGPKIIAGLLVVGALIVSLRPIVFVPPAAADGGDGQLACPLHPKGLP